MWRLLVVTIAACGRLGFEPVGAIDAIDPDSGALDPIFDAEFSAPAPLGELNDPAVDDDPSLTDDLLEIYFASDRTGSQRIFRAVRTSTTDPFGAPVEVVELNAGSSQNNPRVTPDGLAIVFASARSPNAGLTDLWMATRSTRTSAWSAPARIDELATSEREYEPWLLESRLAIYFTFEPAGDSDLTVARRGSVTEPFGSPTPITELSAPDYDGGVWIDPSERVVMFHSKRAGDQTLFVAKRATRDEPFSVPVAISELDLAGVEQDPWVSSDGHTIVFVAARDGSADLFIASR